MASYSGKFCTQSSSILYRPHPIRGKGSISALPIGLKLSGFRGGEEERPALVLGVLFLGVCAALIMLGLDVAINWGVLIGFTFLLGLFAYITQRKLRREETIPWTAAGSAKQVDGGTVEILVKYGSQKRYVRFQLDEPAEATTFLQECRDRRDMTLSNEELIEEGPGETPMDAPAETLVGSPEETP